MKASTRIASTITGAIAVSTLVITLALNAARSGPQSPEAARLERGRYLVYRSGMCIDCHSPRDEKGGFIESKHLTGAPLGFGPTVPMPWMPAAPGIAGLPAGFTQEDTVHFLMTGERPNGRPPPLPPMPSYRFDRADAEAIAAYLASVAPRQSLD